MNRTTFKAINISGNKQNTHTQTETHSAESLQWEFEMWDLGSGTDKPFIAYLLELCTMPARRRDRLGRGDDRP